MTPDAAAITPFVGGRDDAIRAICGPNLGPDARYVGRSAPPTGPLALHEVSPRVNPALSTVVPFCSSSPELDSGTRWPPHRAGAPATVSPEVENPKSWCSHP